jgi:hypothetical protein
MSSGALSALVSTETDAGFRGATRLMLKTICVPYHFTLTNPTAKITNGNILFAIYQNKAQRFKDEVKEKENFVLVEE